MKKRILLMIILISIFQFVLLPSFTQGYEVRLNIVTSISVIGEIVKGIGGSRAHVYCILPEGVDPHDYALTVDNIQKASKADLFVFASVENFSLEKSLLENVPNKPYLDLSDYLHYNAVLLDIPGFQRNFHGYWIKPENALAIAKAVHEKLVELDPDGKDTYDYNLRIFKDKIANLIKFLEEVSENYDMKNLKAAIVVPGAAYVADAFKMEVASLLLKGPGQFINASELAELEAAIKTGEVSLLICPEIMKNAKAGEISEQISRDTGVHVVYVRVFGIKGMNYFELMMYNAGVLRGTINYISEYESFHSDIVHWLYTVLVISVVIVIIEAFVIYRARKKVEMEVKLV